MNISIIIPVYNEENVIGHTIDCIWERSSGYIKEIIVVDGGSTDSTADIAATKKVKLVSSPVKGRAVQMNYGASQSQGEILYFLHADSIPPQNFDKKIVQKMSASFEAGCFRLAFDWDHWLLKSYAWLTRFNIDAFRFGDQSLFVDRRLFERAGRFREDHILMEGNEAVRRLKSRARFCIIADVVTTSARAYRNTGPLKLQLIFCIIYVSYFLGLPQERLVAMYQKWVH